MEKIQEIHSKIDELMKPKNQESEHFLERYQKFELKNCNSTDDDDEEEENDLLYDKNSFTLMQSNNYIAKAFIYNGDGKKGLLGKPMLWMYSHKFTLLRFRYDQPDVPEEIVVFDSDVIYKSTADIMLRTTIDITQDCTTCHVQSFLREKSKTIKIKLLKPLDVHQRLLENYDETLHKYPTYIKQHGRYPIIPFECDEVNEHY